MSLDAGKRFDCNLSKISIFCALADMLILGGKKKLLTLI
jgi:hypothetical protein